MFTFENLIRMIQHVKNRQKLSYGQNIIRKTIANNLITVDKEDRIAIPTESNWHKTALKKGICREK